MNKVTRPIALARNQFKVFLPISTRWMDNDCYGHVNNVVYYSWFDTAVNTYLIEQGALDLDSGTTIGLVVSSNCNYFEPLAFPQPVEAGVAVSRLGRSSVEYRIGIFLQGSEKSSAWGNFVHVYVLKSTRKPVEQLPTAFKVALENIYAPI